MLKRGVSPISGNLGVYFVFSMVLRGRERSKLMICESITPMVVVPSCTAEWISRCLDSGAQAIIVPHVNTVEQAKMCVNASKFPPLVCST